MHPAGRRALVELVGASRHLTEHWSTLAGRLAGPESVVLRAGADSGAELLSGLSGLAAERGAADDDASPALAGIRGTLANRFLERNQALRSAVLDVQHVTTLLAYAESLARDDHASDDDGALATFYVSWQERLWAHENAARGLAIAAAGEPDHAIAPAGGSPIRAAR